MSRHGIRILNIDFKYFFTQKSIARGNVFMKVVMNNDVIEME
jgi:hypothetical protein